MDRPRCFGIKYDYYHNLSDNKCITCPERDPCEMEINKRDEERKYQQVKDSSPRRAKLIDKMKNFLTAHPDASKHDVLGGVHYMRYGGITEFNKAEKELEWIFNIKIKCYRKMATGVTNGFIR
jgi:hypothetical protein